MSSTLNKRKCACGQFITTHDNGTLKRHTKRDEFLTLARSAYGTDVLITSPAEPRRVRCPLSGKFPPAIVRMRYDVNRRIDAEIVKVTGTETGTSEFIAGLRSTMYNTTQIEVVTSRKSLTFRMGSRKQRKSYTKNAHRANYGKRFQAA